MEHLQNDILLGNLTDPCDDQLVLSLQSGREGNTHTVTHTLSHSLSPCVSTVDNLSSNPLQALLLISRKRTATVQTWNFLQSLMDIATNSKLTESRKGLSISHSTPHTLTILLIPPLLNSVSLLLSFSNFSTLFNPLNLDLQWVNLCIKHTHKKNAK